MKRRIASSSQYYQHRFLRVFPDKCFRNTWQESRRESNIEINAGWSVCRTWCTLHLLTNTKILWRTRATNLKFFICGKRNIQIEVKLSLPKDSKQARDFTADHAFFYFLYISFSIPSEVLCSSMLAGGKVDRKLNLIKQCALLAYWPALISTQSRKVVILHHVTPEDHIESTALHLGTPSTGHEDGHTAVHILKSHQDDQGHMAYRFRELGL